MFRGISKIRQEHPGDDLISQMLPAIDEGKLTMDEPEPLCMFLPLAGSEATVNLIGNGVRALLANPDQWDMLRADPVGLVAGVVEETLRFTRRCSSIAGSPIRRSNSPGKPCRSTANSRSSPPPPTVIRPFRRPTSLRHHPPQRRRHAVLLGRHPLLSRRAAGPGRGRGGVPGDRDSPARPACGGRAPAPRLVHHPRHAALPPCAG